MTITEFLLARIAEDEAAATTATPGPWYWDDGLLRSRSKPFRYGIENQFVDYAVVIQGEGYDTGSIGGAEADLAHIARHDPARVLAECEAKRRIVSNHPSGNACWHDGHGDPCWDLRALASVYADHPDYRQEWA